MWDSPHVSEHHSKIIAYTVYNSFTNGSVNTSSMEYIAEKPCANASFRVSSWDILGEGDCSEVYYYYILPTGDLG